MIFMIIMVQPVFLAIKEFITLIVIHRIFFDDIHDYHGTASLLSDKRVYNTDSYT